MIPERKILSLDCFTDLMQQDHIYLVRGFKKTIKPSINSPVVTDILARYLPQQKITCLSDPSGKPRLWPVDGKMIFISLSHVEDILLVALAADSDVGIDVEVIRERRYAKQIAARYFDSEPKNIDDFYRAWTAREAFIKAIGSSIGSSLARIHTKKSGVDLKIGLSKDFSHTVSFFSPLDNFLAALCRSKSTRRDYRIINFPSTKITN